MYGVEALSRHLDQLVKLEASLATESSHRRLVEEWELSMRRLAYSPECFSIRGDRPLFETYGNHPLLAIASILKDGLFPPPELMLWFSEVYQEYLNGKGGTKIEELLFGRLEQGRGGGKFSHRIYRDRDLVALVGGLEDLIHDSPFVLKLKDALTIIFPDSTSKFIKSLLRRLREGGVNQKNWIEILGP